MIYLHSHIASSHSLSTEWLSDVDTTLHRMNTRLHIQYVLYPEQWTGRNFHICHMALLVCIILLPLFDVIKFC